MRLKSIKLAGFKSFVDTTNVPFISNMTAVVGPNGCGKSNIIDAVRWVMGESSAKNLRGESMTDVIFNGSSGRQPVGQASIELLFDNNEGKLPGEYAAFSEIVVKRKVTREGVSQYYLNGSKCRRRDVTDIFLGTGMGPRSYAIIEQGMISKLIESKPEDLRIYLEEAAGISKYKERRRETENRMKRTQENLDRLADIREELGKQLQHLKRQANAAERYAILKKEQRLVSAKRNVFNWRRLKAQHDEMSVSISELELGIEKSVYAKTSNEHDIERLRLSLEGQQDAFNQAQARFYQSGAQVTTLEQQLTFNKKQLIDQNNSMELLQSELLTITQELDEYSNQLLDIEQELAIIDPEIEICEESAESHQAELQAKEQALQGWQNEWEQFQASSARSRQSAELEQHKIQQCEAHLKQFSVRKEKLELELEELLQKIPQTEQSQWELQKEELDESIKNAQCESDALFGNIRECKDGIDKGVAQKAVLFHDMSEKKAVLASLNTLQQSVMGDHIQEQNHWFAENGFKSTQRLMDKLSVKPGWEVAVEHVLGFWLTSVTTESFDRLDASAFDNLDFSLTLLCKNENTALENREGSLATYVSGADALVGLLNTVKPSDSLSDALKSISLLDDDESFITPEGVWVSKFWLRYFRPTQGQEGLVLRARKIADLEREIPELETKLVNQEGEVQSLKAQLEDFETRHRALDQELKRWTIEQGRIIALINENLVKRDHYQLRIQRNKDDLSELELNASIEQENLKLARECWQIEMSHLDTLTDQKDELIERKDLLQEALDICRMKSRDLQNQSHQLELKQQKFLNLKNTLNQGILRYKTQLSTNQEKIRVIKESDQISENALQDLELELEGLLETRLVNETRMTEMRSVLENEAKALREAELARDQFDSGIQTARNELGELRMGAQALEIKYQNLSELVEADDFSIDEVMPLLMPDDSVESLSEALRKLESKEQKLGAINLAAIDEYKIQSERKDYLDAQDRDLMDALETLLAAIRKIDKETRARFKTTYDQVNAGLQRLFPKIFGGGQAYLELTDDDLLETGVAIIAQPPGKKNSTIHLLSGGEKSLTAIALIFAIFELNPAPFCMLDEVDAPLDDANVGRFANMVKEMSDQVQFIYITHNKVSMEMADQLMGVTMHEPGVSRLVSVDVDEAVAMVNVG